jgi:hypothetical protein
MKHIQDEDLAVVPQRKLAFLQGITAFIALGQSRTEAYRRMEDVCYSAQDKNDLAEATKILVNMAVQADEDEGLMKYVR